MDGLAPWLILLAACLALAAFIVIMARVDQRRFDRMLVAEVDEAAEQFGAEMLPPPPLPPLPAPPPHADLHAKYAELAETDPKLAGRLMYAEQMARHGA